jgi:hypothetical protein
MVAALCGASCLWSLAAHAEPASENKTLHEWVNLGPDFVIDPIVIAKPDTSLHVLKLDSSTAAAVTTSTSAMFFPFQTGNIDLTAHLHDGATGGKIDFSVSGYPVGEYTVSAVTVSTGANVTLGTLKVVRDKKIVFTGTTPILADAAGFKAAITDPSSVFYWPWGFSHGFAEFGGVKHPFPDGFSPFDVATVSLSDSNGNVVTTGTLTPVPDGYYHAVSPLVPGPAGPYATGYAMIRAETPPIFLPMSEIIPDALVTGDYPASGTLAITGSCPSTDGASGGTTPDGDDGSSDVWTLASGGSSNLTLTSGGSGTSLLEGTQTYTGGTLTVGNGGSSQGGILVVDGALSGGTTVLSATDGFASGTTITSATTLQYSGTDTLQLSGTGTLTLDGSGTLIDSGGTDAFTGSTLGTLTLSGTPTITYSDTGTGVTTTLNWAHTKPLLHSHTDSAVAFPDFFPIHTGVLAIHAQGLPADATVTYAADGTTLGTAVTNSAGNLNIHAVQGGYGTLPPTLDLFSVQTVTVYDGNGNVLVSAGF